MTEGAVACPDTLKMNILPLIVSLAVMAGAALSLHEPEASRDPAGAASLALRSDPPSLENAVRLSEIALRRDPANPYRWSDMGMAEQAAGNMDAARRCFDRALELGGGIPQISLRDVTFRVQTGETEKALESAGRVLRAVQLYDGLLFGYFDQLDVSVKDVLAQIGQDRFASGAYQEHLVLSKEPGKAREVWDVIEPEGFENDALAADYVNMLVEKDSCAAARKAWVGYLGKRSGQYPEGNLLYNGSFENEPTRSVLDWSITPSQAFDTTREGGTGRDGAFALRIHFHADANVSYENVIQTACVSAGRYTLDAWVRTQNLTTDEGPRLEIFDAGDPRRLHQTTAPLTGTHDWMQIRQSFTVPASASMLAVRVVRVPSQKFDNKIGGDLWLGSVRLERN